MNYKRKKRVQILQGAVTSAAIATLAAAVLAMFNALQLNTTALVVTAMVWAGFVGTGALFAKMSRRMIEGEETMWFWFGVISPASLILQVISGEPDQEFAERR